MDRRRVVNRWSTLQLGSTAQHSHVKSVTSAAGPRRANVSTVTRSVTPHPARLLRDYVDGRWHPTVRGHSAMLDRPPLDVDQDLDLDEITQLLHLCRHVQAVIDVGDGGDLSSGALRSSPVVSSAAVSVIHRAVARYLPEVLRLDSDLAGPTVEVPVAGGEALSYRLPLPVEEMVGSGEVGRILSPTGRDDRTIAKARRERSELLGVRIGSRWRYPRFQLDEGRKRIHPVVGYANRRLEVAKDPWGSLEWWFTSDDALGGHSPVGAFEAGELAESDVDRLIELGEQSMV